MMAAPSTAVGATATSLLYAAFYDLLPICEYLLSVGADLKAANRRGWAALSHYGHCKTPYLSDADKVLRCAALEAAWAEGPHPSQVQRRKEERWERRGPPLTVLTEHAYRPLRLRALAIALAAAAVDPAEPVVKQTSRMQDVCRHEGLVRQIAAFL